CLFSCVFFFSSRRRHTRFSRDWSSDVCSSDLLCVLSASPKDTFRPSSSESKDTQLQPNHTWHNPAINHLSKRSKNSQWDPPCARSEEHTSELQSRENLVCRLLLEKKKNTR